MALWPIDEHMYLDPWFAALDEAPQMCFVALLTCSIRTSLPGLLRNACAQTLASAWQKPEERVARHLETLLQPDADGLRHVLYDSKVRVIRVPAGPSWAKGPNANILTGWYRQWWDVPDCDLKWDHIESLTNCVNLKTDGVLDAWNETFGPVLDANKRGLRPRTSVGVSSLRKDFLESLSKDSRPPSGSGSGSSRGRGSGSGRQTFESLEKHFQPLKMTTKSENQKKRPSGPVEQGHGQPGGGITPGAKNGQNHPATATPERRVELELAGWRLSAAGNWLPPGIE